MKDFIIIPTYNERENIKLLVETIFKLVPDINIIVVDDSSPDGTAQLVKQMIKDFPNLRLMLREKKEGLGKAYISAFRELLKNSEVKKIVTMDADFSHPPETLKEMFLAARDYDFVIGSRYVAGGATIGWEMWRRILSRFANFYCRIVTGMSVNDCTAGFQVIDGNILRKIDLSKIDSSGYAFLMELKYLISKAGASTKEVPIVFKNRVGGESKISSHIMREGILAPWKIRMKN
jgi:dolichol-phosphate mannosyltransferase